MYADIYRQEIGKSLPTNREKDGGICFPLFIFVLIKKHINMGRLKQTFVTFALCASISSCGGLTTTGTVMQIQKGMSQEEVTRLLGKPDYRRFDQGSEQWEYRKTNMTIGASPNMTILIDFIDNRVTNMDSFDDSAPGPHIAICPPAPPEEVTIEAVNRPEHHRPGKRSMNPTDFERLYNKVKQKPFKDDQMELLSVGVADRYFTCHQVARLLSIFTWDDEKMEVLNMILPRITDKENSEVIVKKMDSLFKQDDVRKMLDKLP